MLTATLTHHESAHLARAIELTRYVHTFIGPGAEWGLSHLFASKGKLDSVGCLRHLHSIQVRVCLASDCPVYPNVNGLVLQNQQFELAGVSMHERSQLFGDVSPASLAPHKAWSVSGASGAQLCHFNLMAIEVRRRSGCRGAAAAAAALRRCPCPRPPSSSAHPYMN